LPLKILTPGFQKKIYERAVFNLIDFLSLEESNIYTDLLREFVKNGQ
jgi:hypothetical protein